MRMEDINVIRKMKNGVQFVNLFIVILDTILILIKINVLEIYVLKERKNQKILVAF